MLCWTACRHVMCMWKRQCKGPGRVWACVCYNGTCVGVGAGFLTACWHVMRMWRRLCEGSEKVRVLCVLHGALRLCRVVTSLPACDVHVWAYGGFCVRVLDIVGVGYSNA
jgi:hypothetical protein